MGEMVSIYWRQVLLILSVGLVLISILRFPADGFKVKAFDRSIFKDYERYGQIMNKSEARAFYMIKESLPLGFELIIKPRLGDIVRVKSGVSRNKAQGSRNRINRRHVDFAVMNRAGYIVLAIEVDGPTHFRRGGLRADQFKDGLFKSVGIPLLRMKTDKTAFANARADLLQYLK